MGYGNVTVYVYESVFGAGACHGPSAMKIAHFAVSIVYYQLARAVYIAPSVARFNGCLILAEATHAAPYRLHYPCAGAIDKPPHATLCSEGNFAIELIGIGEHGFYDNLA